MASKMISEKTETKDWMRMDSLENNRSSFILDSAARKSQLGLIKDKKNQSALMMTSFYRAGAAGNAFGNIIAEEDIEDSQASSSSGGEA